TLLLEPKQKKRLDEIMLQTQGPRAFLLADVADRLGLATAQRQTIEDAFDQLSEVWRRTNDISKYRDARTATYKKALDTLTDKQRSKWGEMLGAEVEFQVRTFGPAGLAQPR
ncbi:MAG TPA: hypothetical protein VNI20_00370, partial [Fimbriimonadaceae bacterium]|nr:hypothetical protein [Fimbriimonadaceae bacterium]